MSIPDAPWVGKCRENYYGYVDEEQTAYCDDCCDKFDLDELVEVDGKRVCKECFELYYSEEVESDEESDG